MFYFYNDLLEVGKIIHIRGSQVVTIKRNQKIRKNNLLQLQDNSNKRYSCSVRHVANRIITCLVEKEIFFAKKNFLIHLFIPFITKTELNSLVYKATEIGVTSFNFVESSYSNKIPKGLKLARRLRELKIICQRACENCGNGYLPKILILGNLEATVKFFLLKKIDCYLLHPENINKNFKSNFKDQVGLIVGPKKGFSEQEISKITCPKITLGTNLLKTETAALAALSIFKYNLNCL